MIQIEKGVQFPKDKRPPRGFYPFDELEVTDSFLYSNDSSDKSFSKARVLCCVHRKANEGNKDFKARRTEQGIRIWRVK